MDLEDILEMFCDITGADGTDTSLTPLIMGGLELVQSRLTVDEETIDTTGIMCCEFAAAAAAAYEYVCIRADKETPVMSENGEVKIRRSFPELVKDMMKLRESAFGVLAAAGLISSGFAFRAV